MPEIEIKLFLNIGHSPAWPLVPGAQKELIDSGLAQTPYIYPAWDDSCLIAFAEDTGEPVGFIVYRTDSIRSTWYILMSWVEDDRRREGIHSELFKALVDRAKARGDIFQIESGTHANNHAAIRAFEAQGRTLEAVFYTYRIKSQLDGKDPKDVG